MAIPPLLDELLRAVAPTGAEDAVAAIVRREAASFAEVEADALGSTSARIRGTAGGRLLAIFAHADELGMAVSHVYEDGLLAVTRLAHWEAAQAAGHRVEILGRVGRVPGIVVAGGDGEPKWTDLRVDIGASGREEALALVAPGDPAVRSGPPVELAGGRLLSKALDNRAGVYAGLEALRRLAADPPAWDVALVVNVLEEPRLEAGAVNAARRLRPDAAFVIDVTYATDVPGGDPAGGGETRLGGGPAIFRGPAIHPAVFEGLLEVAAQLGPHSVEVGERTMTDADLVQAVRAGVPTGVVSIPLRYVHSPSELVQLSDIDAASRLVEAYARRLAPDATFER